MSYYDSTVGWYDGEINTNRERIRTSNDRIRICEDEIEELRVLKGRVESVANAVVTATNNSAKKMYDLPGVIKNSLSVLKMSFFSGLLNVLGGEEHRKARQGTERAILKIIEKIATLEREIDNLREEIQRYNGNIATLSTQRSDYIAKATAPKPEAKPVQEATEKSTQKKEETKTTKKTSSSKTSKTSKSSKTTKSSSKKSKKK